MRVYFHEGNGLPMIEEGGELRVLGCLPPRPVVGLGDWASNRPTLDRSRWQEIDAAAAYMDAPVRDQDGLSECTGEASAEAVSHSRLRDGQPYVSLHPGFPYSLVNGGRDEGAVISDILEAVKKYGICRTDKAAPKAIFTNQFNQAAVADALNFRIRDAFRCLTAEEIWSALSLGRVVVAGILVGQNFGNLNGYGVAPLPDRILGGHALCLTGLKSCGAQGLCAHTKNSWSPAWGVKGWCYLTEQHFDRRVDAYAIEIGGVIDDPTDNTTDVPLAA